MKRNLLALFLILFGNCPTFAQWVSLPFTVGHFDKKLSGGGIFFSQGMLWAVGTSDLPPSFPFYSSSDLGQTWATHNLPYNWRINSIHFFDNLNGVMSGAIMGITADGGGTWKYSAGGDDAFMFGSSNNILSTSWNSLFASRDGGATWSQISTNSSSSYAITSNGTIYLGYNPVMASTDNGFSWQPKKGKYDLDSWSMAAGQTCDDTTLYVASEESAAHQTPDARGDGIGKWIASTDGGDSFFPILTNAYGIISGSTVTSKHAAFCATQTLGIIRTTDKGKTWMSIGGPSGGIDCRTVAAVTDNVLFALDTMGNLWMTTNCGGFPIKAPTPPRPQIASTPAKATSCDSSRASASLMHTYCEALTITEATLQGTDASYFSLQPPGLPVSLGNGAKVIFNLGFYPKKQVRSFSAQIHVKGFYLFEYEDTIRIDTLIPVSGTSTAVPPDLFAPKSGFIFDTVSTCKPPVDTIVTLINKGCDTLTITQGPGVLPPEFKLLTTLNLPLKLAPGDTLRLTFRFTPSGTGTYSTSPKFTAVQQGLSQDVTLYLQGSGKEEGGVFSYSPKAFAFKSLSICAHDSASGFVTNVGCSSLALDPSAIFGATDYKLTANGSQLTVKPNDTITYKVYLNPAQKGLRKGFLVMTSHVNGNTRRDSIPFSTTVTDGTRILSSTVEAVDFGKISVCDNRDTLITLRNTGCDTLIVTGVSGLGLGFGTNAKFPIIIFPGKDTTLDFFTMLDTAGGKSITTATLNFTGNSDNTLTPILLSRTFTASARRDIGLYLDPTPKAGGDLSTVTYDIKEAPGKTFNGAGITKLNFDLLYNTDVLNFTSSKSTANLSSVDGKNFTLTGSPNITADANGILATVGFTVYLTKDSTTTIILTNRNDTSQTPCGMTTLTLGGTATFDYQFLCGERSLLSFLRDGSQIHITSIRPNPAQDEIEINLQSALKQDANVEIFNVLGARVFLDMRNLVVGENKVHLDTKRLSSGVYLVKVGGVSQSLVISR